MTSSKLRKHGPKDVSHRDDTEEIPAHGNPQVVQPTDVTILQGSEIPTLHDINNIRAVEEFFLRLRNLSVGGVGTSPHSRYFSARCLNQLDMMRRVSPNWPSDKSIDDMPPEDLRVFIRAYVDRTNLGGEHRRAGTSLRSKIEHLSLRWDGTSIQPLNDLAEKVYDICSIGKVEWDNLPQPDQKELLKLFLNVTLNIQLQQGAKHPQKWLYYHLRPRVENGELADFPALLQEMQVQAITNILDLVNKVKEFAEVHITPQAPIAPLVQRLGTTSGKRSLPPTSGAPPPTSMAVPAKKFRHDRPITCYHCGRTSHAAEGCLLKKHPDANHDPNISWELSKAGQEWKARGVLKLPVHTALRGSWQPPETLKVYRASEGEQCSNINSLRSPLPIITADIYIRSVEGKGNESFSPKAVKAQILLDTGASIDAINCDLVNVNLHYNKDQNSSTTNSVVEVCSAFGHCTSVPQQNYGDISMTINTDSHQCLDVSTRCIVIPIQFDVILGWKTIKLYDLTRQLRSLFVEQPANPIPRAATISFPPRIESLESPVGILNTIYNTQEILVDMEDSYATSEEMSFWKDDITSFLPSQQQSQTNQLPQIVGDQPFHEKLRSLVQTYASIFATTVDSTPAIIPPMELNVDVAKWCTNANRGPPRPQSAPKQSALINLLQQLQQQQIICPSQATEYSQVLLVPKSDSSWRLCIDYRALNAVTESMGWPIPNITRLLHRLGGKRAKFYAVLDLTSGYHQVMLAEHSQKYAAFITDFGVFQPKRISMGLKTAPSYFQQQLALVLSGLLYSCCELYIDDLIIFGSSEDQFCSNLTSIFQRLQQHHILIHPAKAKIGVGTLEYVGHIIDQNGLSMSREKVNKILNLPRPRKLQHLKSFLGMTNYFRDHIARYSDLTFPLHQALQNYQSRKHQIIEWNDQLVKDYEAVLKALAECQKLYFLDDSASIYLETDASDVGIGAFLYQEVEGIKQPIMFLSKTLNKTQRRWSTIEKECFAIWSALRSMEHLLRDIFFTIRTDHRNLQYLNLNTPKVVRWKLAIQEFNFRVEYVRGPDNVVADALSRLCNNSEAQDTPPMVVAALSTDLHQIKLTQQQYKAISAVHNTRRGHFGVDLTVKKLQDELSPWIGMRSHVRWFIQHCPICQKLREIKPSITSKPFTTAAYFPMERISMDSIGPLPKDAAGYCYILVILDNFTRFVELFPLRSLTAEEAAYCVLQHCGRYGTPLQILSDGGSQFSNALFEELVKVLDNEHRITLAYSKQENAMVERANKEVLRHLRAFVFETRVLETWREALPLVQRILNAKRNRVTGLSPAQLLFGNAIDLERDVLQGSQDAVHQGTHSGRQYFQRLLGVQAALIAIARERQLAIDQQHVDERTAPDAIPFMVGDLVLAQYPNGAMGPRPPTKLHTPLRGPLRIVNIQESRVSVQDLVTLKVEDLHINTIRPYYYSDSSLLPNIVALSDVQSFVVEDILRHEGDPKRVSSLRFLVKWLGYDQEDSTWESWKTLRSNIKLHQYLRDIGLKRLIPKDYRV